MIISFNPEPDETLTIEIVMRNGQSVIFNGNGSDVHPKYSNFKMIIDNLKEKEFIKWANAISYDEE